MVREQMFKVPRLLMELQIENMVLETKTTDKKARKVFNIIYFLFFSSFFYSFTWLHLIYSFISMSSFATFAGCEHFSRSFLQYSNKKYVVGKNGIIKAKGQRVRAFMTRQLPQNIDINVTSLRRQLLSVFTMLPTKVYFFNQDFIRISNFGIDSQALLLTNSCGSLCLTALAALAYYLEDLGVDLKDSLATQAMRMMERRQRVPIRMFSRGVSNFITDKYEYYQEKVSCEIFKQLKILQSVMNMNFSRNSYIDNCEILDEKIAQCINELAILLDQIYKFPQKQRQYFYDRIQSMKNRLVHLRAHMKQSNFKSTEQQYRQIYLNTHHLKEEIMEYGASNKRRSSSQINSKNSQKNKYQEIMKVLVEKDEEIERKKIIIDEFEENLKVFALKEESMKEEILFLKRQMVQLNSVQSNIINENQLLLRERESLYKKVMQLESLYNTHRESLQLSTDQADKLRKELMEAEHTIRIKQNLSQNLTIQLRTMEEKNSFELREFKSKEENYKLREKQFKKELKLLQHEINSIELFKDQYKQLQEEHMRVKEDKDVLEASIRHLQQNIQSIKVSFQKEKRSFERELEERENDERRSKQRFQQMEEKLKKSKQCYKQKDKNLQYTEKQVKLVKEKLIEFQQKNIENEKQFEHWELLFSLKEEQIRKLQEENRQLVLQLEVSQGEVDLMRNQVSQYSLGNKVLEETNSEFKKLIEKKERENSQIGEKYHKLETKIEVEGNSYVQLERELEKTRKKFIRAKIEAIHNIRQLII